MNIRRGLFRLWLVLSTVWVVVTGAMYFEEIQSPGIPEANFLYVKDADEFEKIPAANSRYEMRKTMTEITFPNNVSLFTTPGEPDDKERALVPGFLIKIVEPRYAEVRAKRWDTVHLALQVAFVPIAVVFALGGALVWAFSGFSKRPEDRKSH
ncbi:hypothetical protein [Mesorhizobium sp.]|uniref:hypothetical protein n=2 Tax=Mesorhizobium sp. TaxID=1871066 RepID=UPI001206D1E0|nr:hypothetical protein [Mesorhizobium sp.]TIL28826.1 MAG: hypothetical protein E5Y85_30695 [Mesorhizobium sp.]TIL44743.1 MAG: hypothetical protein E5Y86_14790 [Mesorhizobium sp.]TIL47617.1 MAG: hypothetical protein E5Y83_34070 [Mesorhizobium sp.]TIL55600.1 MAG: hypothetical protein E5Y79_33690 [Mesorhizobium sp.]TIM07155.1 MAG: hypothetical protein E5Y67_30270 [Mesorhizobium sp.]